MFKFIIRNLHKILRLKYNSMGFSSYLGLNSAEECLLILSNLKASFLLVAAVGDFWLFLTTSIFFDKFKNSAFVFVSNYFIKLFNVSILLVLWKFYKKIQHLI